MRLGICVLAVAVALTVEAVSPANAGPPTICSDGTMRASFRAGAAKTLRIVDRLCTPADPTDTVQVLVSGSALSLAYWDPGYQPERYSMVRALNAAGFTTFAYDRVGTARSTKPPSPLVTIDVDAWNLHQIVTTLRQQFRRVITLGVSSGAVVAAREAARFHDVDGVVMIGILHDINEAHLAVAGTYMQPAILDPRWRTSGLDPGYVTFSDVSFALAPRDTDPGMRRYLTDTLRDVITGTQQATLLPYLLATAPTDTASINVPVLVAVGEHDFINCEPPGSDCRNAATVRRAEERYFPAAARFDTYVLPGAGHSINSERNAPDWFAAEVAWSAQVAHA